MNKQSRLEDCGWVPARVKNLHMPQMCVKVEENKTIFKDQVITLYTHINKGKKYPYASTKRIAGTVLA